MIELSKGINASYNNNIINVTGLIKYYDKYFSKGKEAGNLSIENGFTTLSDAIEKLVNQTKSFTGLFLDSEDTWGSDDKWYIWATVNDSEIFGHRATNDGSDPSGNVTNIYYNDENDEAPHHHTVA
jgi:hypothetical protein